MCRVGARAPSFVAVLAAVVALSAGAAEGIAGDKWTVPMCSDVPHNVPSDVTWHTASIECFNHEMEYVTVVDLACAPGQTPVVAGFLYVSSTTAPLLYYVDSVLVMSGGKANFGSPWGKCIISPPIVGTANDRITVKIGSISRYNWVETVETQWAYEKSCTEWRGPNECEFSVQAGACKTAPSVCYDADANVRVDDRYCDPDARPAPVTPTALPCSNCTEWRLDPLGPCELSDHGTCTRTRQRAGAQCYGRGVDAPIADRYCDPNARPASAPVLQEPCSNCTEWRSDFWGPCVSSEQGTCNRTRQVRCYGRGVDGPVADSHCNPELRPAMSDACEKCWRMTPRSSCEVTGPSSCATTQMAVCYYRGAPFADWNCDAALRPADVREVCSCSDAPAVRASMDEPGGTPHSGGGVLTVTTLGAVLGATVGFCAVVVVSAVILRRRETAASAEVVACGEKGQPTDSAL